MKTDLLKVYYEYPKLLDVYRANLISTILPKRICLAKYKCSCKQKLWYKKKKRDLAQTTIKQGRPLPYPDKEKQSCKTFQIYYDKELSDTAKLMLTSLRNKYIYYAIEDINFNLSFNLFEKNDLLSSLYSAMMWLHNNQCTNLFDIWVGNIYIQEEKNTNRLIESKKTLSTNYTKIILVLFYKIRLPRKKPKSLW